MAPPQRAIAKSRLGYGLKPPCTPPEDAQRPEYGGKVFRTSPSLSTAGIAASGSSTRSFDQLTYGDAYKAATSAVGLATRDGGADGGGAARHWGPRERLSTHDQGTGVTPGAKLFRDEEAEMFRRKNLRSRVFVIAPPRSEAEDQVLARLHGNSPRGAGLAGAKVYDTTGVSCSVLPTGIEGEIPYMGALALMGGRSMHERRALERQQAALRSDLQTQARIRRSRCTI